PISQKIRALGDLAAGIAHDFNNLLTAIIGSAYLLEDAVDAEDKELARDILDAAERARQLTNQLAVFNRKERVVFAPVDLNRTVSELQRILDRVLGEDITLEIRQAPRPAVI